MAGRIVLPFGDGVYAFRLPFGPLVEELQEKTDAGPLEVYRRLVSGTWRRADVVETIRLGLLGGAEGWVGAVLLDGEPDGGEKIKVDAPKAVRLIRTYVDTYAAPQADLEDVESVLEAETGPLPWTSASVLAAQILSAGLLGKKDEPLGKKAKGETPIPTLSPTVESEPPPSSPPSPIEE